MKRVWPMLLLVAVPLCVATVGPATAQPTQGDIMFCDAGSTVGGMFFTPWPGSMTTLHPGISLNAIQMSHANDCIYAADFNEGNIYRFTRTGACTTVTTVLPKGAGSSGQGMALDQDGAIMVLSGTDNSIYRVTSSSAAVWTTVSTTGQINAICRDGNTGDFIVGTWGEAWWGDLLRVDRASGACTTIAKLSGGIFGVGWIAQTGEYVVVYSSSTNKSYMSWYTSSGSLRLTKSVPDGYSMNVDNTTGRIFVGTKNGQIYQFTYTGDLGYGKAYGAGISISGIDVWQDQTVSTTMESNHTVRLNLSFPQSPNSTYYAALSTAPNPGVPLGTDRWINIRIDPLFYLTFLGGAPYFTHRFVGSLDSSGAASAYFKMPYTPALIYATAVAVNTSLPNAIDVGNTAVVNAW